MSYRIRGLSPEPFQHLYGLSDEALAERGARRCVADAKPGFPDRIELRDAEPGETLLLINHMHQPADTPYRSSHAIFVLEGATKAFDAAGSVPEALRVRPLSLRAFDAGHLMVNAQLVPGEQAEPAIDSFFAHPAVDYIHAHYAVRGCFAARIDRA